MSTPATSHLIARYPWPARACFANRKAHWAVKANATKKARAEAHVITRGAINASTDLKSPRTLFVSFYPPKRSGRDPDVQNVIAACKALIDGVADALGVDDSKLIIHWPDIAAEKDGHGRVEITFYA